MEVAKRVPRRRHSEELKARVLAECVLQGASVAKVAMLHGLNANLVHKWRRAGQVGEVATTRPAAIAQPQGGAAGFVALALPPRAAAGVAPAADIRIELRRGATTMALTWPTAAAVECAALIRALFVEARR